MKFHQFFSISFCCYVIISCSTTKAQSTTSSVVYEGWAVVNEWQELTLTCSASHFPIFKWRRNGGKVENADSKDGSNGTSRFSALTIKSVVADKHGGNYKCTSESDDYGHNLTVISVSSPKLKIEVPQGGQDCVKKPVHECVLGTLYGKLTLKCSYDAPTNSSPKLEWHYATSANGESNYEPVKATNDGRVKVSDAVIEISQLAGTDTGSYRCQDASKTPPLQQFRDVHALPMAVPILKDMTVVEGSTINITCVVTGRATNVVWKFGEKLITSDSDSRIALKAFRGIENATLLIQQANATTDRGQYNCIAISEYGNSSISGLCNVRIKSKYAALAPFLGIVAEVIILCTIILIYEKKRDKTELEESDTDQGPETKSSPDHGQDSVRYRK